MTMLSPRYKVPRSITNNETPLSPPRFDLSPREPTGSNNNRHVPSQRKRFTLVRQSSNTSEDAKLNPSKGIHQRGELGTNSSLQNLPFSLLQIHRDSVKLRAAKDMRRNMKCYLRLCGSMSSGNDAKLVADAQISICEIKMKKSKLFGMGILLLLLLLLLLLFL